MLVGIVEGQPFSKAGQLRLCSFYSVRGSAWWFSHFLSLCTFFQAVSFTELEVFSFDFPFISVQTCWEMLPALTLQPSCFPWVSLQVSKQLQLRRCVPCLQFPFSTRKLVTSPCNILFSDLCPVPDTLARSFSRHVPAFPLRSLPVDFPCVLGKLCCTAEGKDSSLQGTTVETRRWAWQRKCLCSVFCSDANLLTVNICLVNSLVLVLPCSLRNNETGLLRDSENCLLTWSIFLSHWRTKLHAKHPEILFTPYQVDAADRGGCGHITCEGSSALVGLGPLSLSINIDTKYLDLY